MPCEIDVEVYYSENILIGNFYQIRLENCVKAAHPLINAFRKKKVSFFNSAKN